MLLNKQVPRNMIHRKYGVTIKPHNGTDDGPKNNRNTPVVAA